MRRNNFNKSSTGIDIECRCSYDTDRSRRDFEENIKILQHSGYRSTSVGYYIDNGNVPDDDGIKFTVKGSKADKVKYLAEQTSFEAEEIETWDDDTLNMEILGYESDVNLINYALDKMPDAPKGLEFVPTKNLIAISTNGYSQGDYSVVLYCPEDIEKAWGKMPEEKDIQKMVNHYYWDAPIYCQIEINGTEYNYWDMPDYDDYEFKRDEFITYVSKESGVAAGEIENLVPEHPDYN